MIGYYNCECKIHNLIFDIYTTTKKDNKGE